MVLTTESPEFISLKKEPKAGKEEFFSLMVGMEEGSQGSSWVDGSVGEGPTVQP